MPFGVATLKNAGTILSSSGKVVLMEAVQDAAPYSLPLILPDKWWLSLDPYCSVRWTAARGTTCLR